jgi:hypothetical protein
VDQISNAFTTSVVDGEKAAASVATTTFVTDANVVATTVPKPMYTPRSLYMASSDNYMQDIKSFLEKPQIVASGLFQNTDTVSSFAQFDFPGFYRSKSIWVEKLKGFLGIRLDLSFRLVVNATRFQQGRYMLLWKPWGGADSALARNVAQMAGHVTTLVQRTQMPHAEIDINCDTEIEFKIPFSNMYNFCYTKTVTGTGVSVSHNSVGSIQIYPYVPLTAVAGSQSCSYTLYVSAENIELIGVTVPQSQVVFSRKSRTNTEKEQASANLGPISSIMTKVSQATAILSGVPLISSYTTSVGWLADIIGRTANVFGYSRPVNLGPANRIEKNIFPYLCSVDAPDNSMPISLSYKNQLGQMSGISPTDLDEMDFSFLVTIPTWVATISWNTITTDPVGDYLFSSLVGPFGIAPLTTTVNSNLLVHYAPYQLVASRFRFWRGTMVYKFKFVKTEFHSGRLSFAFIPFITSQVSPATVPYADLPYVHRHIVDIRTDNEVIFKVPFVSDAPWKYCNATLDIDNTGLFQINVVDPLVAPDTVSQSISIICEVCMGADAEFAVPCPTLFNTPFFGTAPQMGSFDSAPLPENNNCNEVNDTVGGASSSFDSHNSALLCIGEKITSLRSMLKRATPILGVSSFVGPRITVAPYMQIFASQNGAANSLPDVIGDFYSLFSSCYLYSRGGVRLKFVHSNVLESTAGSTTTVNYFSPKVLVKLVSDGILNRISVVQQDIIVANAQTEADINVNQLVFAGKENEEVQVPHYHRLPLRNTFEHAGNGQYPYSSYNGALFATAATDLLIVHNLTSHAGTDSQDSIPTTVYRSGSDDCNFSYFLSVPPIVVLPATA